VLKSGEESWRVWECLGKQGEAPETLREKEERKERKFRHQWLESIRG